MSTKRKQAQKQRGVWLVGGMLETMEGSKLPSNRQVLARFFNLHLSEKLSIHDSATATMVELLRFWEKARIPTRKNCHIIQKIKKLHKNWQSLKKSKSRNSVTQSSNEKLFLECLDDLFDVAHNNALDLIVIPEDRQFLLAQREKGRRGTMGSVDRKLVKKETRRNERLLQIEARKRKAAEATLETGVLSGSSNSSIDAAVTQNKDDPDFTARINMSSGRKKQKRESRNIITPELASALDRTKVSNRNAMYVLSAAAQSLGHDPGKITLNKESIRQSRRQHRKNIANEIMASFAPQSPLTVHWDGKMLPDLMSKTTVDRIAVVVSGEGTMKLLGVPKISNGTGKAQANAVISVLKEWNILERVTSLCFDTTASNTGRKSGACAVLEKELKRSLIFLPCRHHILELMIGKVFEATIEKCQSGPKIKPFTVFKDPWNSID